MVVNVGTQEQGSFTQGDELALCNINNFSTTLVLGPKNLENAHGHR
jgi:hypothetical protein